MGDKMGVHFMFRPVVAVFMTLLLCTNVFAEERTQMPSTQGTRAKLTFEPANATTSIKDIDLLQRDVVNAWEKMPLTVRRVIFVTEKPKMLGAYSERPSNVFKTGEKLLTYIEPVGYTWTKRGNMFDFGLSADFILKSVDGKILAGQENFAKVSLSSRTKLQEFMFNLTMSLDGADPGEYVLEYKLHDEGSDKSVTVNQPFTIEE
jgi:hypothetical protein